ncbi:MAG: TonB-dependent receptor [Pedobacter sp.]|uniref:SusC/RagA family TonB-linked outer membrane protein n=1 Tax=Pedobacter sp. TaxID=1411316 RepID=UPI002809703F|nr:TonB-dependent receptor [Pedobacter sp.]MDQ8005285.1 TonB-dependent receptor [Pedobacter sp.]
MKKRITQFVVDGCKQSLLLFLMLCYTLGHAQNLTVTGKVIDANGNPLVGVSVKVKGSQAGTLSNPSGNYSITVPNSNTVLVFTFLGMVPKEAAVNGRSNIDITLDEDASSLDAIVVVGYGTQSRRDITGSISSIKEKALRDVPVTNISQMIEGRVPGAYVTTGANKPGTTPNITIRGNRSITANNGPLYVVDGIPVNDAITDFNPSDVVSIEILKDASATAIYGSRGANGVILVTTARGKAGETSVRYNAFYGVTEVVRRADIFTGEEFVKYMRDAGAAVTPIPLTNDIDIFRDPIERESIALGRYTDWQDLVIKKGHTQNHELGISGGTEKTRVNLSLGYFDDEGYFIGQDYKRYTARVNVDQSIGKRIKLGMSILGSYSEVDGVNYGPYGSSLTNSPLGVPYDSEGKFLIYPINDATMSNPLLATQKDKFINIEKRTRILGSLFAEAEIIEGLKYRINFGPDLRGARGGNFNSTAVSAGVASTASSSESYWFSYALDNQLTYDKTFKKHKFNVTALYAIQERRNEGSNISVRDLPVETVTYHNLASGTIVGVGSGYSRWNISSYMGRINYGFDGRFSVTLTGRADGASRFAPGNKWAFFPSAALAYNLSEEKFLKNVSYLSNLKLRIGYGSVGNEAVAPYETLAQLARTAYDFNGAPAFGFAPSNVPNKDLKWETSTTANIAVDFGFLNQRISGSVDVYQTNTTDLLLPFALPPSTGFGGVISNVGATRNRGVEFSLSTQNIVSKNGFQWSTDITGAYNKNEIVELSLGKVDDVGNSRFIGKPLGAIYDYEKIGIWQTGEEAQAALFASKVGQIRVKDQNGDGKVTGDDRTILGYQNPDFTFGVNNNFSFKGFDLAVFVVGVQNKTIISPLYDGQNTLGLGGRYNHLAVDYWTPTNPTNAYPQPFTGQNVNNILYRTTMRYFDGSFVRIRNINLGYTLPNMAVAKIGAKSLRVYFNVTNPFVFSPYVRDHKGIDPEILDNPATINYQLGLNVKF